MYKKLKYSEEHFRYDSEVLLYEPSYGIIDISSVVKNFTYQVTQGQQGENVKMSKEDYDKLLKSRRQKNGFAIATYEFSSMSSQLDGMKNLCEELISHIDKELALG